MWPKHRHQSRGYRLFFRVSTTKGQKSVEVRERRVTNSKQEIITVNYHCLSEKGLVRNYFSEWTPQASLCSLNSIGTSRRLENCWDGQFFSAREKVGWVGGETVQGHWREEEGRALWASSRWFGEDKSNLEKAIKNLIKLWLHRENRISLQSGSRRRCSVGWLYSNNKQTNCNYLEAINSWKGIWKPVLAEVEPLREEIRVYGIEGILQNPQIQSHSHCSVMVCVWKENSEQHKSKNVN